MFAVQSIVFCIPQHKFWVSSQVKLTPVIPNGVDSVVIRLHSRRVTYLEFHPTKDNLLISGDKVWIFELRIQGRWMLSSIAFMLPSSQFCDESCDNAFVKKLTLSCFLLWWQKGQIGIWDFEKVFEKTVYDQIHTCLVNSIKLVPNVLLQYKLHACNSAIAI
jgi:DNA damage-binding protein 2